MEWRDEGIIIGSRRHGESSVILEVMTRGHGRHMGIVRGGRSRRMQPVLQAGNRVELVWRARLDEHLGMFQVEPLELNAARLLSSACAVYALQTLAAHLRLLPERDPHAGLFETLAIVLEHLEDPATAAELLVRFELMVLEELGFGLDLGSCAATGVTRDLVYVSPKSGRAVSRLAGDPYRDRMLPLPAFLNAGAGQRGDSDAIQDAFHLTGFFFNRHVYEPRGIEPPETRAGFLAALRRELARDRIEEGEGTA
ncbi:DNA repair protein RecO [Aquibium oceanicum]|uniref:DNA repair protein RecO n=1 Tax=Aquibium oceanicum TaxID=1670800 RepID=A0A1L3SQS3_9HYPH|nr:DNA repair protein RecO [Aquibium oceanicum]APH71710.1 DNA repair protein RecO [Aquibium oceanicum]